MDERKRERCKTCGMTVRRESYAPSWEYVFTRMGNRLIRERNWLTGCGCTPTTDEDQPASSGARREGSDMKPIAPCHRCGLSGIHRTRGDCIAALRDQVRELQHRFEVKARAEGRAIFYVENRDFFAAAALPEVLRHFFDGDEWSDYDDVASSAYGVADAMLLAREKRAGVAKEGE